MTLMAFGERYDEALPDWAELPFALLFLALLIGIIVWGMRGPK